MFQPCPKLVRVCIISAKSDILCFLMDFFFVRNFLILHPYRTLRHKSIFGHRSHLGMDTGHRRFLGQGCRRFGYGVAFWAPIALPRPYLRKPRLLRILLWFPVYHHLYCPISNSSDGHRSQQFSETPVIIFSRFVGILELCRKNYLSRAVRTD
jgi:hypothetical protein